jgi:hypothetical protein
VITTTFAADTFGDGNLFDLTTGSRSLVIESLDVNPFPTSGPLTLYLYTRSGTFAGNEFSPAGWTLRGSAPINGAPGNLPVNFDIADFVFDAASIHGFHVVGDISKGTLDYTNGLFSVSNTDLTLSGGVGNSFCGGDHVLNSSSTVFSTRTWTGLSITAWSPSPAAVPWRLSRLQAQQSFAGAHRLRRLAEDSLPAC